MKNINDVCLITIDGREFNINKYNNLNNIINHCNSELKFKYSIHFTNSIDKEYDHLEKSNCNINLVKIPQLSYYQYNIFCIKYLYEYIKNINCSHFLMIHDDGFIINPNLWDNNFLNYDYIGAPWLKNKDEEPFGWVTEYKNAVGNGGFCLRSKKFIEECSTVNYNSSANEDVFLCCLMYQYFKNKNIKFADIDTAYKFSIETRTFKYNDFNESFGFHGKHNLKDVKNILENKKIFNLID